MAVQYTKGVFFTVGLAAGVIISMMFVNSQTPKMVYTGQMTGSGSTIQSGIIANDSRSVTSVTDSPPVHIKNQDDIQWERGPLSHDELDKIPVPKETHSFNDTHFHHDDTHVADQLFDKVRVLCWIMTSPENLEKKAKHVKATWAKRCNVVLFVSDHEDKDFPAIAIEVEHGRDHLTAKTMAAFDYVYNNHINDADWFLKGDDDTYVIVENLRYFLSSHSPEEPIFFGHHFKVIVEPQGYFSGGGGYAISKEAMRRFGTRKPGLCAKDHGAEDVEIGRCMQNLGVKTGDSRDKLGRSRFHCFNPETHLHGGYPDWYLQYDKYGAQKGIESISDYPITFHYVSVQQMYDLEFYTYHLRPYGILAGLQDINRTNRTISKVLAEESTHDVKRDIAVQTENKVESPKPSAVPQRKTTTGPPVKIIESSDNKEEENKGEKKDFFEKKKT